MELEKQDFNLRYGESENSNEDAIVGDKAGLLKLKNSIDIALEKGAHYDDLDEFYGVIYHKKEFFLNIDNNDNISGFTIGPIILLAIFIIFIIGVVTIINWIL